MFPGFHGLYKYIHTYVIVITSSAFHHATTSSKPPLLRDSPPITSIQERGDLHKNFPTKFSIKPSKTTNVSITETGFINIRFYKFILTQPIYIYISTTFYFLLLSPSLSTFLSPFQLSFPLFNFPSPFSPLFSFFSPFSIILPLFFPSSAFFSSLQFFFLFSLFLFFFLF